MTKPVTLSDRAFQELRREKRAGESDSKTILRLIRQARLAQRDPASFLRHKLQRRVSADEHERLIQESREADHRDPWGE